MIIVILVLIGLCFGSFTNALVWRLRQQSLPKSKRIASNKELSISKGRSMCPNCKHTLHAIDLIPVMSWVLQNRKCRYCKKPISVQYPLVELAGAALFVISYIFWPYQINGLETISFIAWLTVIVGFLALIIYDLRWMILPNKIVFPLYGISAVFVLAKLIQAPSLTVLVNIILAIAIGGGLFYVLFQISDGSWIGGGDVKLGFMLGALLLTPVMAVMMLFLASVLGTLVALPLMMSGKSSHKARIPFGPFLICATIIVQLFGQSILDWYTGQVLGLY